MKEGVTSNLPQLRKYSVEVENDPNYVVANKSEGQANNGYIVESQEN